MKAVILAGGKATRMGELCKENPKSLLEINGKRFIDYAIELTFSLNLEPLVVMGYKKDKIIEHLNKNWKGVDYIIQENDTGDLTLSLVGAKDYINEDFVFMASDTIFLDKEILKKLIQKDKGTKRFGMLYCEKGDFTPKIKINKKNKVREFNVKGDSDSKLSSPTFFISSKDFLYYINKGDNREIINMMIKDKYNIFAIKYPKNKVLEANTPGQYAEILRMNPNKILKKINT